jgi:hypothetical protein
LHTAKPCIKFIPSHPVARNGTLNVPSPEVDFHIGKGAHVLLSTQKYPKIQAKNEQRDIELEESRHVCCSVT